MKDTHLFLFGGSPPFGEELGKRFADLALNEKGKIAILFIERDGWEEYMPKYTRVLEKYGVKDFCYFPLSHNPSMSSLEELKSSTGIIICGGDTVHYHSYIVDTEIGKYIKEKYTKGIPVAGFSAGALISPQHCVIPPIDNVEKKHLFLKGLGLIKDCVISVHYSKWNEEENLKKALAVTKAIVGYGIDDGVGMYMKNGKLCEIEGEQVHPFLNKELVNYKCLEKEDLRPNLLDSFNRYQETNQVWYVEEKHFQVKADSFIDDWDNAKKVQVIQSLEQCLLAGGVVIGAFVENKLVGFANIEGSLFGRKKEYVELPYIHVSNEYRGLKIGRNLFELACQNAKNLGAKKLYIAAHPSIETQHFYKSVGCTYAVEINLEILAKEPLDIQMEKVL